MKGQLGSVSSSIPLKHDMKQDDSSHVFNDPSQFRKLIGKLLYLTITRPDITFSVSYLSQFLAKNTLTHFHAGIKILKYIKNAPGKGILYKRNTHIKLNALCDVDWEGCPTSRRSITGYYCILLKTLSYHGNKKNNQHFLNILQNLNTGL